MVVPTFLCIEISNYTQDQETSSSLAPFSRSQGGPAGHWFGRCPGLDLFAPIRCLPQTDPGDPAPRGWAAKLPVQPRLCHRRPAPSGPSWRRSAAPWPTVPARRHGRPSSGCTGRCWHTRSGCGCYPLVAFENRESAPSTDGWVTARRHAESCGECKLVWEKSEKLQFCRPPPSKSLRQSTSWSWTECL